MSDIMAAFHNHLRDDAGVAALVSTRIYEGIAPANAALPRVTLNRISSPSRSAHQGGSGGLVQARIQIDCWGSQGAAEHVSVADAVRDALDGFMQSTMGDDVLDVRSVTLDAEWTEYDTPVNADESGIPRVIQEYLVWYAESVPTF